MNTLLQDKWPWIEGSHGMRSALLDLLTDADLSFNPGGSNMAFGALWREMGEIECSYVQSLKTFKQDFAYRNTEPGLDTSVARLRAWFQALDDDMKASIADLSVDDAEKQIERGSGYMTPIPLQLDVYLQALLIFFGKVTIFMRTMNKPLPSSIAEWIG